MGGFARRAISLIQKYAFALKGQVQTTTGLQTNDYWSVLKRLFVSYANNYSIALRANSGLSAIDYCSHHTLKKVRFQRGYIQHPQPARQCAPMS